jgi:aryl-alcohol dehydrogenase-like predicted oxidoreductase
MAEPEIECLELRPGYRVPRLINGAWQLADGHRLGAASPDLEATADALCQLVDAGFYAFDGADIYTGVEALIGKVIARRPGRVRMHTKCVPDLADLPGLRREQVARIVDRSLRRLGVERLDLVQFHWWDFGIPGHVEAMGWLAEQQRAGKIHLLGVTNYDTAHLAELVDAGFDIASHQVQYSLLDRRPAGQMTGLCREHGIHLLSYGTLAGGFLTDRWLGRLDPVDGFENRSQVKYRLVIDEYGGWRHFQQLLAELDEPARRHGVSLANLAVRAVLDRPAVGAAILGSRGPAHLASNRRTFALRLDAEDRRLLEEIFARHEGPAGDVYALEREKGSRHAAIMRYGLNASAPD